MYKQFYRTPCKKKKKTPTYLEGQLLARSVEFPSTLVPSLVTIALHWLLPLSPLSHPSAHITLFTMTTLTITVFFVWTVWFKEAFVLFFYLISVSVSTAAVIGNFCSNR
jgi:hypothetical protein